MIPNENFLNQIPLYGYMSQIWYFNERNFLGHKLSRFCGFRPFPQKFMSTELFKIGCLWNFVPGKFKNWPSAKVHVREITNNFSSFLIFHHTFLNDMTQGNYNVFLIYLFLIFTYIIKAHEVDSKKYIYIKGNVLYSFEKYQTFFEHSLKWKLK